MTQLSLECQIYPKAEWFAELWFLNDIIDLNINFTKLPSSKWLFFVIFWSYSQVPEVSAKDDTIEINSSVSMTQNLSAWELKTPTKFEA